MNISELPTRQYQMKNSTLIQSAEMLKLFLERDIADLAARGMGAAQIAELDTLTQEFKEQKPDTWWRSNLKEVVAQRDALRTELQYTIEEIRVICSVVFKQSPTYNSFQFEGLSRVNNKEYIVRVQTIIDRATEHSAELSPKGINAAMITALTATLEAFDNKRDQADIAESVRNNKTLERIQKGNELWNLVDEYARLANIYYKRRDAAKANDYYGVINPPKGSNAPTAPTDLVYNTPNIYFEADEDATSHELHNSTNNINYDFVKTFTGEAVEVAFPTQGALYYRIRSRNSDNMLSPFSEPLMLVADLAAPDNARYENGYLIADQVPGANQIEWQFQDINAGNSWTEIAITPSWSYEYTLPNGHWNVRCRAIADPITSSWTVFTIQVATGG